MIRDRRRVRDPADETPRGPAAATVTICPDGPLVLRGTLAVREVDGTPVSVPRTVARSRRGRSAVKPLCDGSHQRGSLTRSAG